MSYQSFKAYPYLPAGKSYIYVPADNQLMIQAAIAQSELSTDDSHPTGAVVVKQASILGRGANQSALKNKLLREFHKKYFCIRRLLKIPSGKMYWICPGCASARYHAEAMAIKDALSKNTSIAGSDLYIFGHWWCCKPCWDKMLTAKVENAYLVEGATEKFST